MMPICNVPPSRTRPAACKPIAYLVSLIGSDGGANSGKSVSGLSSTAANSSAGRSPAPGMNGSSELTWPISLNDARPCARARSTSSVVSVLQLRL
ncbi:hypothetical protein AB7M49_005078 [Bradyrhizobium elkanii]